VDDIVAEAVERAVAIAAFVVDFGSSVPHSYYI